MENQEVTTDNYGITIHHPPAQKYVIGWWQIEKDGFRHWLNHLSEKRWFSDRLSQLFIKMCRMHYNLN